MKIGIYVHTVSDILESAFIRLYRTCLVSAQYYCDGDDSKVDSIILPGMKGIHKEDLIKAKDPAIIFILVDDPYDLEIQKMLAVNDHLHTVTLRELALMDDVIESFYGRELYEKYKELPNYSVKRRDS